MGTNVSFQFRNEQFSARSRKTRGCAEAYRGTSHKQARSLTPRLQKRAIYRWKLAKRVLLILNRSATRSGAISVLTTPSNHRNSLESCHIQTLSKRNREFNDNRSEVRGGCLVALNCLESRQIPNHWIYQAWEIIQKMP